MTFAVGDLGCAGVDVDAFKRTCRAPMHPEGWNRWLLWRTTRDEPSALDIERSTYAVLGKWFELVENAEGISVPGRGTGKVDNVKIRVVPWDFMAPWRVVARREDCTPLPHRLGQRRDRRAHRVRLPRKRTRRAVARPQGADARAVVPRPGGLDPRARLRAPLGARTLRALCSRRADGGVKRAIGRAFKR